MKTVTSKDFATVPNSMVIAPAGFGKTYLLAETLKYLDGKKLILTHTNAGVEAINKKIKKFPEIEANSFMVSTIDGYMRRLILDYLHNSNYPWQEDGNWDYCNAKKLAIKILDSKTVCENISLSFDSVLVDEYQDCSLLQHEFIVKLKEIIPIRIVGDPLQSIFGWQAKNGDPLVDMENIGDQFAYLGALDTPWRWQEDCPVLGEELVDIRNLLVKNSKVDLSAYKEIEVLDLTYPGKISKLLSITNEYKNVFIIDPVSGSDSGRILLRKTLDKKRAHLLQPVNFPSYPEKVELFEVFWTSKNIKDLVVFLKEIYLGKRIDMFFTEKNVRKTNPILENICKRLEMDTCLSAYEFMSVVFDEIGKSGCIYELFPRIFLDALTLIETEECSLKNAIQRGCEKYAWRPRDSRGINIGTTLLLKGLETDCVIIWNTEGIPDIKNLYVALTRASKKVYVFSSSPIVDFNKNNVKEKKKIEKKYLYESNIFGETV